MTAERLTVATKRVVRRLLPRPVYRVYRRCYLKIEAKRFRVRKVTHTYGGITLQVEIADGLAESWYDHDWPALPELEILKRHGLGAGSRVFDIGAHQGVVALMLADAVGESGHVIAVEAEPHNARAAARNRDLNLAENVTVVHAAGADRPGNLLFTPSLNGRIERGTSRWGKVEVPAVTVDQLARRHGTPDCVVVDVEGFEGFVLAGASETIARGRTLFLVEVHVGHGLDRAPQQIASYFAPEHDLYAAPVSVDIDQFRRYEAGSDVNLEHFFLVAVPSRLRDIS